MNYFYCLSKILKEIFLHFQRSILFIFIWNLIFYNFLFSYLLHYFYYYSVFNFCFFHFSTIFSFFLCYFKFCHLKISFKLCQFLFFEISFRNPIMAIQWRNYFYWLVETFILNLNLKYLYLYRIHVNGISISIFFIIYQLMKFYLEVVEGLNRKSFSSQFSYCFPFFSYPINSIFEYFHNLNMVYYFQLFIQKLKCYFMS